MDVLEATGRPLSQWQGMSGKPVLEGLRTARFVIAPPREILSRRIDLRFETMVKAGALEEARALLGLDPALPAAKALGLPQLWRHLTGEIPRGRHCRGPIGHETICETSDDLVPEPYEGLELDGRR